ncbi:uncharacterized protein si:dkey-19b23.7 [Gadus macrocephalus]|uniref:uncharacterized protein si:dkey-19b23.7 n=1 Tax=Gadus macrocephalus TaxID=80720 RepID=UPI0028CB46FA|nr:uncharacterized protein si:dkey-19b23.7 [Gadus macrocephalus]
MSSKREREQKRKLQHFLTDLALLGSLQGFRYFQPWLRGKEELLLTVVNEDPGRRSPGFVVSRASSGSSAASSTDCSPSSSSVSVEEGDGGDTRPGTPGEICASRSAEAQRDGRGGPTCEDHLLPASPSEREMAVPEVNCTLFLLAGYAKYGRPYAWIRSNHERLVNIGGVDSMVRDTPMKLRSITDWQTQEVRIWDVVNELVGLCTNPSPSNPFALDVRYVQNLPLPERFLVSGALLNFLETYVVHGNKDELHYDRVVEEVKPLRRLHVQSLLEWQKSRTGTGPLSPPTMHQSFSVQPSPLQL